MARKYNIPIYYSKYRWIVNCTQNPNHPDYRKFGARGVTSCWGNGQFNEFREWLLTDLGEQPSSQHQLSRIDKRKGFYPKNLEWQLPRERSRGHTLQNVFVKFRNQSKTLAEWSEELGIAYYTLRRRIAKGDKLKDIVKDYR